MAKLEQLLDNRDGERSPAQVALFLLVYVKDTVWDDERTNPQDRIEEGLKIWSQLNGVKGAQSRWEQDWLDFVLSLQEEFKVFEDLGDIYYWEHETYSCGHIVGWCSCGSRGF